MDNLKDKNNVSNVLLPTVYPLIGNKRWYAENGTVYNEADEDFRVLMVAGEGSEISLPNDVAEKIAEYLNGRCEHKYGQLKGGTYTCFDCGHKEEWYHT